MRKLNTILIMSAARHPQVDGLIERVHETVQIVMRCYSSGSFSDLVSHIPIVDFYYNLSTNETSTHLKYLMNIYQLTSWYIVASDWCTGGSLCQPLVWLGKCLECCSRVANTFQAMCGFSFFSTSPYFCSLWFNIHFFKGLHIHLCDQRLGPFRIRPNFIW